jgi:boron transporter
MVSASCRGMGIAPSNPTPPPTGLIPQAPMHTASLVILGVDRKRDDEEELQEVSPGVDGGKDQPKWDSKEKPIGVVEQRVSNLVQGSLCE